MKLSGSIIIAAVMLLSASAKPLNAQIIDPRFLGSAKGITASATNQNESALDAQFNLLSVAPNGEPIVDRSPDNNVGLFTGAIQGYQRQQEVTGVVCSTVDGIATREEGCKGLSGESPFIDQNDNTNIRFDASGFPVFITKPIFKDSPVNGTFLAQRFISRELGENDIFSEIVSGKEYLREPIVAYSVIPGITDIGNPLGDFLNKIDEEATLNFVLFSDSTNDIENFQIDKAVNDISYILENNLLSRARGVSLRRALVQAQIRPVPESQNIGGLIAISIVFVSVKAWRRLR